MQEYEVLDKHYTPEEGQVAFIGTLEECEAYKANQCKGSLVDEFMFEIHPIYSGD